MSIEHLGGYEPFELKEGDFSKYSTAKLAEVISSNMDIGFGEWSEEQLISFHNEIVNRLQRPAESYQVLKLLEEGRRQTLQILASQKWPDEPTGLVET